MGILGSLDMGVYVSATTQYKDLWTVELLGIQVTSSKYMVLEKLGWDTKNLFGLYQYLDNDTGTGI